MIFNSVFYAQLSYYSRVKDFYIFKCKNLEEFATHRLL